MSPVSTRSFTITFSIFLLAVTLSTVTTQHAFAVSTINFDNPSLPSNFDSTPLVNNYENDGVFFTTNPGLLIFRDDTEAVSKNNILVPPPVGMRSGDIVFSTVDPVSHSPADATSVSFWLVSIGQNPVIVTVKDKDGNTVDTQTFGPRSPSNGLNNVDYYTFSGSFRSVTIQGNLGGGDGYGIDDLRVEVPDPPARTPVGGIIVPVDMTALFVAGAITNAVWMIPTLGGIAGAVVAIFKIKRKRD